MSYRLRQDAILQPRISIAVVTSNFNHARYLPEAIESVLSQSRHLREFIIIDDGSTDTSVEVIEYYAETHPTIQLVRQTENRGAIRNINEILPTLRSSHLVCLSADDKILPGFLATAVQLLEKHPQAGLCLCDYESFWDDGRRKKRRLRLAKEGCYFPPEAAPRALYNTWPHGQSVVRVSALIEAGSYREDLRWHCDWFASWAICARHGFCYAPEVGSAFRISDNSFSGQGRRGAQQRDVLKSILRLLQSESYTWLRGPLREANAFSHFGPKVIGILLSSPGGRHFLTVPLVAMVVRQSVYDFCCLLVPHTVKEWVKQHVWQP